MKLYVIVPLLVSAMYLQASDEFMQNKLDNSDIVMVDVLESVLEDKDALILEQIESVKSQVKQLIQLAQEKKDKRSRVYNFITVSHTFNVNSQTSNTYVHYVVLCVEIDTSVFKDMMPDQLEILEKLIFEKIVALYQSQKLSVELIAAGVYVSCVQLGVEKIETK